MKDEYGSTVGNIRDHVDKKLSGETAAQLARQPLSGTRTLRCCPELTPSRCWRATMKRAASAPTSRNSSIPNLNKELTRVAISSVVLGGQRIDMKKDALYTSKNQDKGPSVNPLIQDWHQADAQHQ